MPTEEEGRRSRIQAERGLREATEQWPAVHDVSKGLERVHRDQDDVPDPFIEALARAMRPRPRHHRGEPT